jgi:23S rRNA (uracil1939-C5)-methyltransferase
VFQGQGLGRIEGSGKVAFAWNALPGETVELKAVKNKKTFVDGVAVAVDNPSPHRIAPIEDHYLSCSPWQIFDWAEENRQKVAIARETYQSIGGLVFDDLEIAHSPEPQLRYRNKMEYSFTWSQDEKDELSLGFFNRGGRGFKPLPEGCVLAEPGINETALAVVDWLRAIDFFVPRTKSLIIRSNGAGQTIAALFIKDEVAFDHYPTLPETCLGFQLYQSDPRSPASLPTKLLYQTGADALSATLGGVALKFGLLSFFQVNIGLFERALDDIRPWLDPDKEIVDYYSGVGAIGLALHRHFKRAVLVDNNPQAIDYARDNIAANGIANCEAVLSEAEKITDLIATDKYLILDPPRAGLHQDVTNRILEVLPERILYLSCNLSTHARDIALLKDAYAIDSMRLYNFFPRTPHIEALCVLTRR